MLLEKTLQRIKNEIKDQLQSILPIERPGLAVIINEENDSLVKCAEILKEDCDEIGINWFSAIVNSSTDETFVYNIINDFNEMEDVNMILIPFPLPITLKTVEEDIRGMLNNKIYYMELVYGETTPGTRITVLESVIKDL